MLTYFSIRLFYPFIKVRHFEGYSLVLEGLMPQLLFKKVNTLTSGPGDNLIFLNFLVFSAPLVQYTGMTFN